LGNNILGALAIVHYDAGMVNERAKAVGLLTPETLVEAVRVFGDEDVALRFMMQLRWGGFDRMCCPRASFF
jgi:hypothetical protein